MDSLGIFAKFPQAGKVKSRLGQSIGFKESSDLYSCFTKDITCRLQNAAQKRTLCYTPATSNSLNWFKELAGDNYDLWLQPENDLGSRMLAFIQNELDHQAKKVVVIGTDSPSLPVHLIEKAFEKLDQSDVVIGPATDGGFYLIGFSNTQKIDLSNINWSSETVLTETVDLIYRSGLSLDLLTPWYDIDSLSDLYLLEGHIKAYSKIPGSPEMKYTMKKLETLLPMIKKPGKSNK